MRECYSAESVTWHEWCIPPFHMSTLTQGYLSQSEVARRANAPQSHVRKAVKAGRLVPDFTIGRVHAFKSERLPELTAILATYIIQQ